MTELEVQLTKALDRMAKLHHLMMKKVNHGASAYDATCIREMNEAPGEAQRALDAAAKEAKATGHEL